jgi:iron complex outermembrane receptor protein
MGLFCVGVCTQATAAGSSIEEVFVYGKTEESVVVDKTMSVSKTMTDLLLLPQSVVVLNRAFLDQQGSRTLSDALINVSGVSGVAPSETLIADYKVRGFDAFIYYDQLPAFGQVPTSSPESLINIERIEAVKGPTSTLYGGGVGAGVGGLINIVTKSPELEASTLVGMQAGSFNTVNPYFDVNQPVSDTVGLRLTGSYQQADSQFDAVESTSWSLNPSALFRFSERSDLTLKGQFSDFEYREYAGIPAIGSSENASYEIPLDRYPGATDTPKSSVENNMVTARWNYVLSDSTGFNLAARYFDSKPVEYSSWPAPDVTAIIADTLALLGLAQPFDPFSDPVYAVVNGSLPTKNEQYNMNANLVHRLQLGQTEHQLLFGVDADRTDNDAALYSDTYCDVFAATTALIADPFNPIVLGEYLATVSAVPYIDISDSSSDVQYGPKSSTACFGEQQYRYESYGVYLQDQISIGERWHIDAGLRGNWIESRESDEAGSSSEDRSPNNDKVVGRFGVTYSLSKAVSLFTGYGQGFQAPIGVILASTATPEPSESESWEAGVKWRAENGSSGNLAYFELQRTNIATADPSNPGFQTQVGEQESKGVELDFVWMVTEQWRLLGNFADIDAKVTEDNTLPEGEKLARVPGTSGRLSLRHEFGGTLSGLAVQVGALYRDSQQITLPNTFSVDDYTIFDSQVSYAWRDYVVRVAVSNITDKQYFDPHGFLGLPVVQPGGERAAYVTLEARF